MAAIICQSVASLCNNVSSMMCVPCQACCQGMSVALSSPFMPYLAVTLLFNIPPMIWALKATLGGEHCETHWMMINGILCLAHCLGALYIVRKVQEHRVQQQQPAAVDHLTPAQVTLIDGDKHDKSDTKYKKMDDTAKYNTMDDTKQSSMEKAEVTTATVTSSAQPSTFNTFEDTTDGEANTIKRLTRVLCYDGGVAIYIVIFIGWCIWISRGFLELLEINPDAGGCDSNHLFGSIFCGWIYMFLVCCALSCSLVCLRR